MTKTIYVSDHAIQPPLPDTSLFTYLTGVGGPSPLPKYSPDLPAFIDGATDRILTRGDLINNALKLAGSLNALGLGKGSTACIWGFNSLPWAQAVYGCLAAGVTLSPANYAYEPHELAHQLNNSGAEIIFIDADMLPKFDAARKELKRSWPDSRIILLEQSPANGGRTSQRFKTVADLVAEGKPVAPAKFDGDEAHNNDAWRCYSSGTTGLPKGVQTSHWNMTSQLQCANIAFTNMAEGKDVVLCFLPFSHIYAVTLALCQPFSQGRPVVVLPRFEEIQVLKTIQKVCIPFTECGTKLTPAAQGDHGAPRPAPLPRPAAVEERAELRPFLDQEGDVRCRAAVERDLRRLPEADPRRAHSAGLRHDGDVAGHLHDERARVRRPGRVGRPPDPAH